MLNLSLCLEQQVWGSIHFIQIFCRYSEDLQPSLYTNLDIAIKENKINSEVFIVKLFKT